MERASEFVFNDMTVFRYEVVLQTVNPSSCLPLQIPKAQQTGQGGVIDAYVELLYIHILEEMLQGLHNCQQLSTGHTVVPLALAQF